MLQDANLDKFRVQFEKLHNALQDATQSNGRLQVKNREVNAELVANAAKVSRNTIQKLYTLVRRKLGMVVAQKNPEFLIFRRGSVTEN